MKRPVMHSIALEVSLDPPFPSRGEGDGRVPARHHPPTSTTRAGRRNLGGGLVRPWNFAIRTRHGIEHPSRGDAGGGHRPRDGVEGVAQRRGGLGVEADPNAGVRAVSTVQRGEVGVLLGGQQRGEAVPVDVVEGSVARRDAAAHGSTRTRVPTG